MDKTTGPGLLNPVDESAGRADLGAGGESAQLHRHHQRLQSGNSDCFFRGSVPSNRIMQFILTKME